MRIQPLYDLQIEVNRLFIAGSKFAQNDPRLLKQVSFFNKLGEKAPVFKKIAQNIEELCQAESSESVEKLTALSTLLYAVLYTQGETFDAETSQDASEINPLIELDSLSTTNSYFQLKPIIQALTISNQGRLAILEEALKQNSFDDFRLYPILDNALADKYAELAQFVEDKAIPSVGKNMLPYIYNNLSYEGKTGDVRRLRLLSLMEHPEIDKIVEKVLQDSSPIMQAAAILILAKDKANEAMIVALTNDKQKVVREAAFEALSKLNTTSTWRKLVDFFLNLKNKTDSEAIVRAISSSNEMAFVDELINKLQLDLEAILKQEDEKKFVNSFEQFHKSIAVLENKESDLAFTFFQGLLNPHIVESHTRFKTQLEGSLAFFYNSVNQCLNTYSTANRFAFFEEHLAPLKPSDIYNGLYTQYFLDSVSMGSSKEQIFTKFSGYYEKNYFSLSTLLNCVVEGFNSYYQQIESFTVDINSIDSRWTPIVAKKLTKESRSEILFLHLFLPKNDKEFNQFLIDCLSQNRSQNYYNIQNMFIMIMSREISDKYELVYELLIKNKNNYYFGQLLNSVYWKDFPKEYVHKFRDFGIQNTNNTFFEEIAEIIENNYLK